MTIAVIIWVVLLIVSGHTADEWSEILHNIKE
jgi:hypothetical protein